MLVRRLLSLGGGEEPTVRKPFPTLHVVVMSKRSRLDIQQVRQRHFTICDWYTFAQLREGGRCAVASWGRIQEAVKWAGNGYILKSKMDFFLSTDFTVFSKTIGNAISYCFLNS
jgi:hypothetical protein